MSILNPQTGLYEFPPVDSDMLEMKQRMNAQERQQEQIRCNSDDYEVVTIGSPEYKAFIKKIEQNLDANQKLSVCILCWGFITFYQKRRHQEHSAYIVTPTYFKTEALFLKLARQHQKLMNNGENVAIFADQCKISQNSFAQTPARSITYGGEDTQQKGKGGIIGAGVNEIRAVSSKQIEHEAHYRQLNQLIAQLCSESDRKSKRIKLLEDKLASLQASFQALKVGELRSVQEPPQEIPGLSEVEQVDEVKIEPKVEEGPDNKALASKKTEDGVENVAGSVETGLTKAKQDSEMKQDEEPVKEEEESSGMPLKLW